MKIRPGLADTGEPDAPNFKEADVDAVGYADDSGPWHPAIGNLARAYLALRATPSPADGRVTEAMVERCIEYEWGTYDPRPNWKPEVLAKAREFYRGILTAALTPEAR